MDFLYIVTFVGALLYCEGRYFRPFPISSEPQSVFDAIERNTDLHYNDKDNGITVIRDVDFRSCYITDYDPEWRLDQDSKIAVMAAVTPKIMRNEDLLSQFINHVGPIVGKLCRTSKIYEVKSTDIDQHIDESPVSETPPVPRVPSPRKIYYDSGEPEVPRPFRIPTKKPEFQKHNEHEEIRFPTKRPEFSGFQHRPFAHEQHAHQVPARHDAGQFVVPRPFQQAVPQLKHRGHGHFRK
ncbi:uncharacterized protein LOC133202742 [Saccostrea echinata]|uniref:uncharacterized protein LOC133202742 n=1 Tax=Saccostrea echinata TaxID=191078 RepID=UPI002A82B05D|nr:uncharacterized protein LOC133202742 [Saccostrea echinata]